MNAFQTEILGYFERRFPFFEFTLPVLLLLYPFIPTLVPLYMLPIYYGLHFFYLFLMVFNLKLLQDLAEKKVVHQGFKHVYSASTIVLLVFCLAFNFLERSEVMTGLSLNWRGFFFFLSCLSVLSLSWLWYGLLRPQLRPSYWTELLPQVKYPLILLPPLFLKVHSSQWMVIGLHTAVLLLHAICFEVLNNEHLKKTAVRPLLIGYSLAISLGSFWITGELVFALVISFLCAFLIWKGKNLNEKVLFPPTIMYGWGVLFFS